MRKSIIILSAVWLGCGISFAQKDSVPTVKSDSNQVTVQDTAKAIVDVDSLSQLQTIALPQSETEQPVSEQSEIQNTLNFLKIAVIVLAVLVIGLIVFVFLDRRKRRDIVLNTLLDEKNYGEEHRLQHWLDFRVAKTVEDRINKPTTQSSQSVSRIEFSNLQNEVKALKEKFGKSEDKTPQPTQTLGRNTTSIREMRTEQPTVVQVKKLFALNIIDGYFNKVSEQISGTPIFELTVSSPSSATFTVYKGAYTTVLAAPEYLEGCDKQTLSDNPQTLQVIEGKATRGEDGKWKIIQKANVKLV
ncbi:hypothetical protein FACS189437_01800 [Bacteroidia bacterium]|nr:hypothetical protein FACS189437_01800 [Bacteroidia bacterium]